MAKGDAVRDKAAKAQAKVDELREVYRQKPTEANGKRLLKAREEAQEALAAKHEAFPQEKPPTQVVM